MMHLKTFFVVFFVAVLINLIQLQRNLASTFLGTYPIERLIKIKMCYYRNRLFLLNLQFFFTWTTLTTHICFDAVLFYLIYFIISQ